MRGASYFFPWYPGISVIFSILMVSWYLDGIQYFDGIPVFQWYSVFWWYSSIFVTHVTLLMLYYHTMHIAFSRKYVHIDTEEILACSTYLLKHFLPRDKLSKSFIQIIGSLTLVTVWLLSSDVIYASCRAGFQSSFKSHDYNPHLYYFPLALGKTSGKFSLVNTSLTAFMSKYNKIQANNASFSMPHYVHFDS